MNRVTKKHELHESLGTPSNAGWKTKRLGELAELAGRIGWRGLTAKEYTESGPLFLSVHSLNYGDAVDFRDAFHITQARYDESPEIMLRRGDILICKDGAGIGKLGIVAELPSQATINSSLLMIRPGKFILPKYLYYCLSSPYFQQIVLSRLNGATTPHLYQRDITDFPVHFPSPDEQERIVAILDEAFDGIAMATSNAKQNLQNVNSLISSYFDSFLNGRKNWTALPIHMCFKVRSGDFLPAKQMDQTGSVPVYGGNGIAGYHIAPNLDGDNIIIGRVGAKCGNVRRVKGPLWLTDNALYVSELLRSFDKDS